MARADEGTSFERAYHRAALGLWPRERFADVLLQAGVTAVLPYFAERVAACGGAVGTAATRKPVLAIARRVLGVWEETAASHWSPRPEKNPSRPEMIASLVRLGDAGLLERFIGGIITRCFDGSETRELAAAVAAGLEPPVAGQLLGALARAKTREVPDARWKKALQEIAAAIVAALPSLKPIPKGTAADSMGSAANRLLQRIARIRLSAIGYLHWSLFDNYEWGTFTPRFGLFPLDFTRLGSECLPVSAAGSNPSMTYARLIVEDE